VGGEGDVLIVALDDAVREMATRLFRRAGYTTSAVTTGEEALAAARADRPSLVILELELGDMSGFEVCHELRDHGAAQDLPIIIVSGDRTESSDKVAGLLIGADDYLAKPFDPDELLVRARRILNRAPIPPPTDNPLTGREVQVMQLLADGMSQDAIAKELFISPKTVATHIQRIITKLGVHSRTQAVALAYRDGLIQERSRPSR
jgi:DNA-binding NarL/FixJ family response regulator